jgi:hypothetical protein
MLRSEGENSDHSNPSICLDIKPLRSDVLGASTGSHVTQRGRYGRVARRNFTLGRSQNRAWTLLARRHRIIAIGCSWEARVARHDR